MKQFELPELLANNLKKLTQYQPILAKKLYEYIQEHGLPNVSQEITSHGMWVSTGGFPPFFQKAVTTFAKKKNEEKFIFYIFGTGVPPFLFSSLRTLPPDVLGVVVFEPNPELVLQTFSLTSVYQALPGGSRISFVVFPDDSLIDEALGVNIRPLGIFVSADPEIISHNGESEAYKEQISALLTAYRERLRLSIQFLGNTAEDTLLGIRNMFLNAPWIWQTPSLAVLKEKLKGNPVIWVGSGPSLEKNVHLLKDVQGKTIIIAAESATKKLLRLGIVPHFTVAIERPYTTYSNLIRPLVDEFPKECTEIVLAAQSVLPSQSLGCWPGPVMVFGKAELELDNWLVGHVLGGTSVYCGISVAHMALSLAAVFEASSVALIGQDLAFGEGLVSHAQDTASVSTMAMETERGKKDLFRVPGVLGEEVETHFIWFAFLKVFEKILPRFEMPIFDCTEGGALIKGTIVTPLSEFLREKVVELSDMEKMPADLVRENIPIFSAEFLDEKAERMEETIHYLDSFLIILDEIEKTIYKAGAAALSPKQRREFAFKASGLLDDYHGRNRALAFIGQSYTFLAGASIAKVRNLESVEDVREWKRIFKEIVTAHRRVIQYVKNYVENALAAALFYKKGKKHTLPERCTLLAPLSQEEGMNAMDDLLTALRSGETKDYLYTDDMFDVCMQNIIARSDPPHQLWDPEYQWHCALFLERQERIHMATLFMEGAAAGLIGKEIPVDSIVAFFKDAARIFLQDDFTHPPQAIAALNALNNAKEYAPEDREIAVLRKKILDSRHAYLLNLLESGVYAAFGAPSWSKKELQANILLVEERLPETLELVWEMLEETAIEERSGLAPFLDWLIQTLTKCRHAVDPQIRQTVEMLFDQLARNFKSYSSFPVLWTQEIVQELEKRGVKFAYGSSDKKQKD